MAVYSNGIETKKLLIAVTYQQILQKDVSAIRVRDIASLSGCSPAAIYRHFETLEYLIVVSALRILDSYTKEYGKLLDASTDPVDMYMEAWELFDRYAFERPDVYYRLFWGPYNKSFEAASQEYYELFPYSGSTRNTAYFFMMFFNGDMEQRDYMALRNIANVRKISVEDARYLSKVNPLIAKGLLEKSIGKDKGERDGIECECTHLITEGLQRAMNVARHEAGSYQARG